jgi:hypothetical protein
MHHQKGKNQWKRALWASLLALLLALACGACGGDDGAPDRGDRLSDSVPSPSGQALVLSAENTAVPLRPPLLREDEARGDLTLMQSSSTLDELREKLGTAVVTVQIIDEAQGISQGNADTNPAPFQAPKRLRDLYSETEDVLGARGLEDWDDYVLVFDLFRLSGNWLVRWDGTNLTQYGEPGGYGLWRDDMREEIAALIRGALNDALGRGKPVTRAVIGQGMERLLAGPDGGVNPADYANFVAFYQELVAELEEEFPEVQFSAGLNWDNLVTHVAALYTESGDVDDVKFGEVRAVWRDVAAPLYDHSGFVALSSSPEAERYAGDPAQLPSSHYALLAEVQGDKPVVWHSIQWPATNSGQKSAQGEFLTRFLELNGGVDVDLVTWAQLIDQPEGTADCNGVVNLGAPISRCFSGLFRDSLAPVEVSTIYLER